MRIATIGTGSIARRHLGVLSSEPEIEIVGHVTSRSDGGAQAAQRWGGRAYTDYREMLDRESPDAVWICVPPGAHGHIERELIARGTHFFVEKPLSADRQTAEEVARALHGSGVIAGVGYHWRAMDTIPEVQSMLVAAPPRMALGAWHDAMPPPEWWRHESTSGGQMVEQATHLIDLARYLAGEAAVVSAAAAHHEWQEYPDADVAGVSAALLRHQDGAVGVFTATCMLAGRAAAHLQLVCEGSLITITQERAVYEGKERREVRCGNDPFLAEDRAFLEAVRASDPSLLTCDYDDALRTHRLCCDVRDAAAHQEAAGQPELRRAR